MELKKLLIVLLTAILLPMAVFAQSIQPVYSFTNGPAAPNAGLTLGPDGNFYGTTGNGGSSSSGTIFRVTTNGILTPLYSFAGGTNGAQPDAGLALGPDGNFYGTTVSGGNIGFGTIFRVTTNGVLTSLYSFTGSGDGEYPYAELTLGPDGNFYGTTSGGGGSGYGTVFRVTTNGMLTSSYSFTNGSDGANPNVGLALGPDGNFYGASFYGGSNSDGTIFQFTTNGVLTPLYSFTGGNDGAYPQAELALGPDGNFYGTSVGGGGGYGTIFRVTTTGVLTPLYSFTDGTDGASPEAGLTLGPDDNFYGTTAGDGGSDYGTVFQVTTNGVFTPLYSFTDGTDGAIPYAGLALGPDGNFYGTTYTGGDSGNGTVFQVTTNGVLTPLDPFPGESDGANPHAQLTLGPDGNFYGTTENGGDSGNGTVFQVTTNGLFTPLYSFTNGFDGAQPYAGLALGPDGNFYGTTFAGGSMFDGTVFQVTTNGVLRIIYSFTGGLDGMQPCAGLTLAPDGNFYGTTLEGGSGFGYGTIFRVTTNGVLTPLYSFPGGTNGAQPYAGLTLGPDGNLYGLSSSGGSSGYGTMFQVTTNGGWTLLYTFTGGKDGSFPHAGLTLGPDGNFYGTALGGGASDSGTMFRVTTNGVLTPLYSFTGGKDGANPYAELSLGPDGNFYGTTGNGGSDGYGTVFRATTAGVLTPLYSFMDGNDGATPYAGLTLGPDNNFYGTTYGAGNGGAGLIYRLNLAPAIAAPVISLSTWNSGGYLLLQLTTATNISSRVYATTNLVPPIVWQPIYTNSTGGTWQFTDTNTTGIKSRYYRLSTP